MDTLMIRLSFTRRSLGAPLFAAPALARPARAAGEGSGLHRLREARRPLPELSFFDADGAALSPARYAGRALVINLWATWCPPCVAEMPAFDRAQALLRGEGIAILPLSSDRGGAAQVRPFYERLGLRELPILLDPRGAAARALGVRGLPTTVITDRAHQEVARLEGEAVWDHPEVLAALRRLAG
jgi:thiol-disulfide isomerase/thioredoxin